MRYYKKVVLVFVVVLQVCLLQAQSVEAGNGTEAVGTQALYKNPNLSADERALDMLHRLTLEEKVSLTLATSPAIKRLDIPAVDWWNEALHGVARAGKATVFPQTIGLAATFNSNEIFRTYNMISDEARAKHHFFKSQNSFKKYQGLTFWTPNINIFRDPRWGRGQETYGEDPYLTTQMGMAVVRGLQGDGTSKYDKLHACAKHFAVHSGPEWNRHSFDPKKLSSRNLWETYLPAFKALVQDAGVKEVMCAYNRYDGEPCCSNKELLINILRKDWGFNDVIVSDCGAVEDFYRPKAHETHPSAIEASADAVKSGTDLCCGNAYKSLTESVKKGFISESELDTSVFRLLRARFQLGMFDADSLVSWAAIPYSVVESKEHVTQALKMARESIVLLKNKNNALPLRKTMKIAVLGPNANDSATLWGNYNGFPTKTVTILEGIRSKLAGTNISYEKGCDYVSDDVLVSRLNECRFLGQPGFKATFWNTKDFTGPVITTTQVTGEMRYETGGNTVFAPGVNLRNFSARFETELTPLRTGDITFKIKADDGFRLLLDGKEVLAYQRAGSVNEKQYILQATAGKKVAITLEYFQLEGEGSLRFDLGDAGKLDFKATAEKYKNVDAFVFVGGISPKLEGEQMSVDLPGFIGGDRLKLELPDVQLNMLKALKATGKPVIFVICSGSSMALPWESQNLDGIIEAWYPGQQGGTAVADVLFGDYNPAGRLPITFYNATSDLPDYENYDMTAGRTYRYFKGKPAYPFGYGLSYTSFIYRNAALSKATIRRNESTVLKLSIQNTGKRSGDEVVQVYIVNKQDPGGPAKSLRAFRRVNVLAGKTVPVTLEIPNKSFEFFNPATEKMEVIPGNYEILYGSSSDIKDLKKLPLIIK
ncbi:MAG: xylan 1,4-beta-xylosidase [Bacteroidota bacterium]